MSVDYQDDLAEQWDMAATMSDGNDACGETSYASLNEAMDDAGSIIGDMRANLPIAFRFKWQDMSIFCRIVERDSDVVLELDTDLGPLPYTVEDKVRRNYLKKLCHLGKELPSGAFIVTEQQRFRHRLESILNAPITGSSIVTAVVQLLLASRPYYALAKAPI